MLGFHQEKLQGFKLVSNLWASYLFWCSCMCTLLTVRSKYSFKNAFDVSWQKSGSAEWSLTPCFKLKLGAGFIYSSTFVWPMWLNVPVALQEMVRAKMLLQSMCPHVSEAAFCSSFVLRKSHLFCHVLRNCSELTEAQLSLGYIIKITGENFVLLFLSYMWDNWTKPTVADSIDLPFSYLFSARLRPLKRPETYCLFFLQG